MMAAYVHDYGAGQNGACVSAESNLATLDSIICDLTNRLGNIGSRLADTVNNIYGVRPEANAKDQARLDTAPNGALDGLHRALSMLEAKIGFVGEQVDRLSPLA